MHRDSCDVSKWETEKGQYLDALLDELEDQLKDELEGFYCTVSSAGKVTDVLTLAANLWRRSYSSKNSYLRVVSAKPRANTGT